LAQAESGASFLETPAAGAELPYALTGRQIGAYRLDAALGAGGMGEVYRATDTRLGRQVAVKILPPAAAIDPARRGRFEREARAVAALNHPNICTIHDVGHDGGIDFLVMELIDGESLASRLARGPMPPDEALARACEIADALDTAHGHGIIHRDLKPANIMIARSAPGHDAQVKLLDFGLARVLRPQAAGAIAGPPDATPETQPGVLLGTPHYMPPEQIEGKSGDARSDIFAFGAVLSEMLTGRRAFAGRTTAAVIAAVLRGEPPAVQPREVDRILRRCLAKDPLRRYQSARDLLNDLEEVRAARAAGAGRPPARTWRHAAAWLTLAGVTVAAAALGYAAWSRPGDPEPLSIFQLQPPPGIEVEPPGRAVLAISPDGRWIAFRGIDRERREAALYLRSVGERDARRVAANAAVPFFSPDSQWLGFVGENIVARIPVRGGRTQEICKLANAEAVRGASWARDGTVVLSVDGRLVQVSSEGGEPSAIPHRALNVRYYWPHVLPSGRAALVVVMRGITDRTRTIAVVSLADGTLKRLEGLAGTAPRYVPTGHVVYSRFGELHAVTFDLERLDLAGEPVKVLDDVSSFNFAATPGFDVAGSGALVYIPAADDGPDGVPEADLVWLDRQGKAWPLVDERKRYTSVAISPDGTKVAAVIAEHLSEGELWIYDLGARAWNRLTTAQFVFGPLVWTPDGQQILFTSFAPGEGDLFRIRIGGGVPERLTSDDTAWEYPSSVTPDGSTALISAALVGQMDIRTLGLSKPSVPAPFATTSSAMKGAASVSPNGQWVAFHSAEHGRREIFVRPFAGGGESRRLSPDGGTNPWWGRGGRELLYQRETEVWSLPVDPGNPRQSGTPRKLFASDILDGAYRDTLMFSPPHDRFLTLRRPSRQRTARQLVYVPDWLDTVARAVRPAR
jgi:serine/threonine-protein kinase